MGMQVCSCRASVQQQVCGVGMQVCSCRVGAVSGCAPGRNIGLVNNVYVHCSVLWCSRKLQVTSVCVDWAFGGKAEGLCALQREPLLDCAGLPAYREL